MKKLATLLVLFSLGLFLVGCGAEETPPATDPVADPAEPMPGDELDPIDETADPVEGGEPAVPETEGEVQG